MTNLPTILRSLRVKINAYLAVTTLVFISVLVILEIKLATELRVQLIGADKNAFIPGLDESILFDDADGKDFILSWLRDRHQLIEAKIDAKVPDCLALSDQGDFFDVCWNMRGFVQATHAMRDSQFLVLKLPITFSFDLILLPTILVLLAVLGVYLFLVNYVFRKLERSIHRPIVALAELAAKGGDMAIKSDLEEIKTLAQAVVDGREVERHKAITSITQSLAHDIKNSLGAFEYIKNIKSLDELHEWQNEIQGVTARIWRIIDKIGVARVELTLELGDHHFDLSILEEEAQKIYPAVKITSEVNWDQDKRFHLDPLAIERLVFNLVKNSVEAGAKQIHLKGVIKGSTLNLSVIDDGPGVAPPMVDDLFKRGKSFGKEDGQGIGLYNVSKIVAGHGGKVEYSRESNKTIFSLELPGCVLSAKSDVRPTEQFIDPSKALKQQSVVVSVSNRQRHDALIAALANYPIKIYDKLQVDGNLPSLVITDNTELIDQCLGLRIPILMENGKDDIAKFAEQIARRVRSQHKYTASLEV